MKLKSLKLVQALICFSILFNFSTNVFSQLTYIACNSTCPGKLIGHVTFANKTGTTTGRWTVNDLTYGGLVDEKFEITDPVSFTSTNGNLTSTGGGTYTIVSDPGTVNGPLGTALKSDLTDGILLFRSNDNANPFSVYTIKGLDVKGKYCVRIKIRNAAKFTACSNAMAVQMQFRSLAGLGISGGGVSGGQWNRTSYNTSCSGAQGGWDGNNQTDGVRYDEYVSIYETNFQIGQNPNNTNDDGFKIYFRTLGFDANDVWGIDEIEVYGCVTQQIFSSNGNQICNGTPTTLTAQGIGSTTDTYEWRVNDASGTLLSSTTNTIAVTPDAATTYWVKCIRTGVTLTNTITPVSCCGPTGLFTVPKVCEPITVDGVMDTVNTEKVWSVAPWIIVDGNKSLGLNGPNDCGGNGVQEKPSGRWRTVYDNTNIYFFIQVFDDNPANTQAAEYWWMDGVEVYLKNAAGAAKQFGAGYSLTSNKPYGNFTGVTHKITKSATYWEAEVSIPLAANNIDVTKGFINLELGINQSKDGTTCRSAQVFSWIAANHYSSSAQYHVAPLSDCASVTASNNTICNGGATTLSTQLTTINNSPVYTWQSSPTGAAGSYTNISPSPGSTNKITVSPIANTYYRAINDGVASCPVMVAFSTLNINANSNATAFCSGSTMTLTGSTTESGAGVQWGWKKGAIFASATYISGYELSADVAKKIYSKAFAAGDEGNYYFVVNKNGCEVFATLIIKGNPNRASDNPQTICSGKSYVFNGHSYTIPGDYKDTLKTYLGCDSIITTHLTVNSSVTGANPQTICLGKSYTFNGHVYSIPGDYKDTLKSYQGCDSIVTTHLTVNSTTSSSNPQTICSGKSYVFNGHTYTLPGDYKDTLKTYQGCDSIVTTHLTVNSIMYTNNPQSICNGDNYIINGHIYTLSNSYKDTLKSSGGCDSIITTILTVNPTVSVNNSQSICPGSSYVINGHTYMLPDTYKDTLKTKNGCDSIITTILTYKPALISTNNKTICSGTAYTFNKHVYNKTGLYKDTLKSNEGCDSIITTNLTVNPPVTSNNPQVICFGGSYSFNGNTYSATGNYNDTIKTPGGCDSIVITQLTVKALLSPQISGNTSICAGNSTLLSAEGGIIYTWSSGCKTNTCSVSAQGTYTVTATDAMGCSGSADIAVSLSPSPTASFFAESNTNAISGFPVKFNSDSSKLASSWYWDFGDHSINGNTENPEHIYTNSGVYSVLLIVTSSAGCKDSLFRTNYITVKDQTKVFVPTAFSPNNDGNNDYLEVYGEFVSMHLEIYDQWGIQVYSSSTPKPGWDGKYKGKDQPAGNYTYVLQAINLAGREVKEEGLVTLVR